MTASNKAHMAGIAGAAGPLLVAFGLPPEVAAGLVAVVGWLATYFIPNLRKL